MTEDTGNRQLRAGSDMNRNIAYESGYWGGEEFEDLVARSLIACYETKIANKARRAPPCHRITEKDLQRIRSIGCYFAPADRVCYDSFIDIPQRDMPIEAIWAHADENNTGIMPENPDGIIHGYVDINYCRKINALPREIIRKGGGVPYEIVLLYPMATQIDGIKLYCTVDRSGVVHATSRMVNFHDMTTGMIKSIDVLGNNEDTSVTSLSAAIGFYDDNSYAIAMHTHDIASAADFLKIHPQTLGRLARAGEVPASRIGRAWVFLEDDLVAFLRSRYFHPGQAPATATGEKRCSTNGMDRRPGGQDSPRQVEQKYGALLALPINGRRRSTKTS